MADIRIDISRDGEDEPAWVTLSILALVVFGIIVEYFL